MTMTRSWLRPVAQLFGLALLTVGIIALTAGPAGASTPPTTVKVLRPVTTTGQAAHGWKTITDNRAAVNCHGETSSVAVDRGIAFCGSSADYLPACWKSATPHRVLCIAPDLRKTLRSIRYYGTFSTPQAPATHPEALTLALRSGLTFFVRVGGAADRLKQHPSWFIHYYQDGSPYRAIAAPPNSYSGINESHAAWQVKVYRDPNKAGYTSYVGTAYFVGTAH